MKAPITKVAIALLFLAACDGNANSPTQPQLPRFSAFIANYYFSIGSESGTIPDEVQVLLDGAVIYSGPMYIDPLLLMMTRTTFRATY